MHLIRLTGHWQVSLSLHNLFLSNELLRKWQNSNDLICQLVINLFANKNNSCQVMVTVLLVLHNLQIVQKSQQQRKTCRKDALDTACCRCQPELSGTNMDGSRPHNRCCHLAKLGSRPIRHWVLPECGMLPALN